MMVAAYNESAGLEDAVTDALAGLRNLDDYEVIIVNDGSTDGTAEIADRLVHEHEHVRVVHHPVNRGLAAAYRSGLEAATKDFFTWIAGDAEIEPHSIVAVLSAIGQADLVIPYHEGSGKRTWYRRLLTWFATGQINMLFGWHLRYYQGPTVYPRLLGLSIPVESRGFFFASEMLIRAMMEGYSFVEVPIHHKRPMPGQSNAVKIGNLISAQISVVTLWWSLRLGLGVRRPVVRRA
jgi:glycosyltransferase involved in cell wall biosynthesis